MTDTLIQLFARPPVAGRVKTRLIPMLGADNALAIYRHCLQHNLDLVRHCHLDYQVWLSEASSAAIFDGDPVRIQQGADLGERMLHALSSGLTGSGGDFERVLLIGSDCLDLSAQVLDRAVHRLDSHELVLVPACDGGYVLIAARQHIHPGLFAGIDWGTRRVLRQTLLKAMQAGINTRVLNPLRDIDRCEDLQHYAELQSLL